jgi:2,4-dienoyl-CoA reductase-like NADH-dependent reductase (Old Yellow Enzyme family)
MTHTRNSYARGFGSCRAASGSSLRARTRPVHAHGKPMIIDLTAAARRADAERAREWLANQRVFISSAMGDTNEERQHVAAGIEELGARALWFEEFGRDADPRRGIPRRG